MSADTRMTLQIPQKIKAMFIVIAFTMNMAYNSKRETTAAAMLVACL